MAIYFRKRIKIFPGVYLNISKTGFSLSFGTRGASVTAKKTGVYGNLSVPGTGVYMRKKLFGNGK